MNLTTKLPVAGSALTRISRFALIGILVLNLLVIGIAGQYLYSSWQREIEQAWTDTQNLALVNEREIATLFDAIDTLLRSVAHDYNRHPTNANPALELWKALIKEDSFYLPSAGELHLADALGTINLGPQGEAEQNVSIADRDYFVFHRDHPDAEMLISQPIFTRVSRQWALVFSRRLNDRQGSFAGLVMVSLPLTYFQGHFASLKLGRQGSISLRDRERRLIYRYPELPGGGQLGSTRIADEFSAALQQDPTRGSYRAGTTCFDGVRRVHSFRRNDRHGFYINAGIAEDDVLENWRGHRSRAILILSILVVISAGFLWYLRKSLVLHEQALQQLSEGESRLRIISSLTSDVLFCCNRDHEGLFRIDWLAGDTQTVFGRTPEEMAALGCFRCLVPAEDQGLFFDHITNLAPGESSDLELHVTHRDGSLHLVRSVAQVEMIPGSGGHRLFGALQDITQRRKNEQALEDSRQRLTRLVASSPDWIWEVNADGVYTFSSPRVTDILGYAPEEVLGRTPFDLMPPDEALRLGVLFARLVKERADIVALENVNLHKDGRPVVLETSGVPVLDDQGEVLGYQGIDRDISERKQTEQRLKQALNQAEQAAKAKAEFLAHMSHEIRTPMNGILGLAELALRCTQEPGTRDYLDKLHQSGTYLMRLLDDILDYSKIEAGGLRLELVPVDLERLLTRLASLFSPVAALKEINLCMAADPDVPRWLQGDLLRLEQVLSNLLGNALKFTDRGEVKLQVTCLGQDGGQARLRWEVTDTGIGMDQATQARLFSPFTQGDGSIARRFGGTGLGLSISLRLAHLMGGQLWVDSQPDSGSRFILELPLDIAEPGPQFPEPALAAPPNLAGRRVLVAEDHPINQQVIGDMLRLLGVRVSIVQGGRQALDYLAQAPVDLVLMDIQMPDMDGLTATQELRRHPDWANLPVIALTAGVTQAERERIRASGMNDLLAKPLTLAALTALLQRWLPTEAALPDQPTGASTPSQPGLAVPRPGLAPPLQLPGFDLTDLKAAMDQDRLLDLLRHFAQSTPTDLAAVQQALERGDAAAAGRSLHRLLGAASILGATRVRAAAVRLSKDLREPQPTETGLALLTEALEDAVAHIQALPEYADGSQAPVPAACSLGAGRLEAELRTRLNQGIWVSRGLLEAWGAALPVQEQVRYQVLKRELDRFDYRAAAQLLGPPPPDAPLPAAGPADEPPTLLIADDDPTALRYLGESLQGKYRVKIATHGQEALAAALREPRPDLILLDRMMPGMDGGAVFDALKRDSSHPDVPVIFITEQTDTASETEALAQGAVDYLRKPVNPELLRARIALHLELRRGTLALQASLAETRRAQDSLAHLAHHDPLTDLANRSLFFELLTQYLALAQRQGGRLALLFIDLDRFKEINDRHGHGVGDRVLQQAAQRMLACVRAADMLGRIGGDEFLALLPDATDDDSVLGVAERIRRALREPFLVDDLRLSLSSSIGVAFYPEHGQEPLELIKQADFAMYRAKDLGRDHIQMGPPGVGQS